MDNIVVRDARRTDIAAIAKIQCSAWQDAFKYIITAQTMEKYTDTEKCAKMLERVYDGKIGRMYIAEINSEACGTLFWKLTDNKNAEIVALHTIKRVWGRDVGRIIMEKAITDMFGAGVETVSLWVFKDNIRARRFYEKVGFAPAGKERVSGYDDALEMQYRRILR